MNAERRKRPRIKFLLLQKRRERCSHPAGQIGEPFGRAIHGGSRCLETMVEMDDHWTGLAGSIMPPPAACKSAPSPSGVAWDTADSIAREQENDRKVAGVREERSC